MKTSPLFQSYKHVQKMLTSTRIGREKRENNFESAPAISVNIDRNPF